jgi:hypothetical protein
VQNENVSQSLRNAKQTRDIDEQYLPNMFQAMGLIPTPPNHHKKFKTVRAN